MIRNNDSIVRVLPESVARRIAAGEVIDRPYAAVRELLDNAVDSGATEITLLLSGGGIDEVRVVDNGHGMHKSDLELCWLPHATSKIENLSDLESITTLGFRGEALSSLAACSRLEITANSGESCNAISVHGGKVVAFGASSGAPGTVVAVRDLFFNMPARRRFLRTARTEGNLCRRIFLEKAAAHPGIAFRLFFDGVLKSYLPVSSHSERVAAAWPRLVPHSSWWESNGEGAGVQITVVHSRPEMSRRDRQYIQIYTNRRRIDEFSLLQGVCHAYDAWMPGGSFPVAFVFIEIQPDLVDFNIHPAKKEARFRDIQAVRHQIVEIIRNRLVDESYRESAKTSEHSSDGWETAEPQPKVLQRKLSMSSKTDRTMVRNASSAKAFVAAARQIREQKTSKLERFAPKPIEKNRPFRYLGQVLGVFLIAESEDSLFIVDQHAAHERILFESCRKAPPAAETLLIPRRLDLDQNAAMRLELRRERLQAMGIEVAKDDEGIWMLRTLPQAAQGKEELLATFLEEGGGDAESLERDLWANLVCKSAVKDNYILDNEAAEKLLREAFDLDTPRCPHGRPIWFEISRTELFELVGRTV